MRPGRTPFVSIQRRSRGKGLTLLVIALLLCGVTILGLLALVAYIAQMASIGQ